MQYNEFCQPIGDELVNFCEGKLPIVKLIKGEEVTVEKLGMKHFEDLYEVYGPASSPDPYYLAIVDNSTNKAIVHFH